MRLLHRRSFAALFLGLIPLAFGATRARAADDLVLDQLIDRHAQARGGKARLDAVRSLAVDMQIVEKGEVIEARYRCDKSPAYRIDIYAGGKHVFCEGLDAAGTWIWPGGQAAARQGVEDGKRAGLEGIQFNIYGLHAFPALGNKLSLDGREMIAGVNYYVVRVDLAYGDPAFLYIDPQTYMIARRREVRAYHPDMDATKQHLESQYTDFRDTDGIAEAFLQHQVNLADGAITQVVMLKRIQHDPALRPGELTRGFAFDKS
jgi:hypothetical protein